MKITNILRLEAFVVLAGAAYLYGRVDGSWLVFALLLLVPDIFMAGYAANNQLGAKLYNLGHSYVLPVLALLVGYASDSRFLLVGGLIWVAHIAMDRTFGYGLKKKTGFKHTHLGIIRKED